MGVLFRGRLSNDVLNAICIQYGVGDPCPREPGSFTRVRWKQFAIDFDNIAPPPPPPLPDPSPQIIDAMRKMNEYCNLNGIDLVWDFEEYMGGWDSIGVSQVSEGGMRVNASMQMHMKCKLTRACHVSVEP